MAMHLIQVKVMNKEIKADEIEDYIVENYGTMRHDKYAMADAINSMKSNFRSYGTEAVDPWDIFLLIIENKPIERLYTHSYGFQTRTGRGIIEEFKSCYYEMV